MSIAENIARIRAQMNEAAVACGRDPASILLCAATKMNDAAAVREAIAGGVDCCGENRVQELVAKELENAYEGAPVHFIGVLQTNKVKRMVEEGCDCAAILVQLAAVRSAIDNTGKVILNDHIRNCMVEAVQAGDESAIDDLCEAVDKFMK